MKTFDYKIIHNFTNRYLKTYYQNIDPDELAVITFLVREIKKIKAGLTMLEVGCGPTIHHVLPFAKVVSKIDMADYLPENLSELKRWVDKADGAHDWKQFTKKVLELEGVTPSINALEERNELLRAKINQIIFCNVLNEHPLEKEEQYDIVGFFYCAEEVALDIETWRQIMKRVCEYIKPGGHLFLSALGETTHYSIVKEDGTLEKLPTVYLTINNFREILPALGFDMSKSIIKIADTPEQTSHGINKVILVNAKKDGLPER
jgi:hypothetical protein